MHSFDTLNQLTERCRLILRSASATAISNDNAATFTGFESVLIQATGEAALAAELLVTFTQGSAMVPVVLSREAVLPAFVGPKTLVVALAAVGSDPASVAAVGAAADGGAKIAVLSSSGHLADMAYAQGYPLLLVPSPSEPGAPLLAEVFVGACGLLSSTGLLPAETVADAQAAIDLMGRQRTAFGPEADLETNPARLLTSAFRSKIPLIYGTTPLAAAAALVWADRLRRVGLPASTSDIGHDAASNGWPAGPKISISAARFEALILREAGDDADGRVGALREALGSGVVCNELGLDGRSPLERLWGAIYLAEWTSFYLM